MRRMILFIVLFLTMLLATGCTVHFKGENLELDGETAQVYNLQSVTFTKDFEMPRHAINRKFKLDSIGIFEKSRPGMHSSPRQLAMK